MNRQSVVDIPPINCRLVMDFTREKMAIPIVRSPILAVWEAMNLLNEVERCSGGLDLEQTISQAEAALINLISILGNHPAIENSSALPCADLIQFVPRTR
jgi:hypothetical protein